jgi:hypothetical protein
MKNNFKGFEYYELKCDDDGNIQLSNYHDILSARRARMDMLLDGINQDNADFVKLHQAFNAKFVNDKELLSKIYAEDEEVALERSTMLSIFDSLDNISHINTMDLLAISLLLSNISDLERNVVLGDNAELSELKELFRKEKGSNEYYTDDECNDLADYIDRINYQIQQELIRRGEDQYLEKDEEE